MYSSAHDRAMSWVERVVTIFAIWGRGVGVRTIWERGVNNLGKGCAGSGVARCASACRKGCEGSGIGMCERVWERLRGSGSACLQQHMGLEKGCKRVYVGLGVAVLNMQKTAAGGSSGGRSQREAAAGGSSGKQRRAAAAKRRPHTWGIRQSASTPPPVYPKARAVVSLTLDTIILAGGGPRCGRRCAKQRGHARRAESRVRRSAL